MLSMPPACAKPQRPHRLLRFSVLLRVALLVPATATLLLTAWSPGSVSALLADGEGNAEDAVASLMMALLLVGWLDVVVNDWMPERWQIQWARRNRHLGYSLLGAVHLVKAYAGTAVQVQGGGVLVAYYTAFASVCIWYTLAAALRPDHEL